MSVTQPTYDWNFRQALSNGSTVTDQFSQETLTYDGPSSTVSDGVSITQESDHIDFGNTTVSIPPTFTIEMYYKTGSTQYIKGAAHTNMMARLNKPDYKDSHGLSLRLDSGTYYINYPTNEGNNSSVNVIHEVAHNWTANTTYHFVLTFSTTTSRLYVNNVLLSTETLSTPFNNGVTANHGGSVSAFGNKADITWLPFSANIYFARIYHSELTASEIDTLYANRETNYFFLFPILRINYGDVYLAQTLNKTIEDYKAENIPLHDISFGAFPSANKYKQSYAKTLLDLSGEFVHRKHTFIGDISFNNDLSINNVMVLNNDLSLNTGVIVNGDAFFNGNVNAIGDVSLNGNLKLKDKSIEKSKLNFTIIENEGTFDTSQDVSLNSTFTVQGDFDKYIDTAGNIQTDFSENVVLIPSSLGLDLSGGSATLSGKTGDQAFLNGTYIVKDNSGNTTGNIYDDLHENTAVTPGSLSVTPDYYWDFRVATPSGNTLADRVSGINATYVGGITSNDVSGVYFNERETIGHTTPQTQYLTIGSMSSGTNLSVEIYAQPHGTTQTGSTWFFHLYSGTNMSSYSTSDHYLAIGVQINSGSYNVPLIQNFDDGGTTLVANANADISTIVYGEPAHIVMNWNNTSKELNTYINGSLTHTSTHSSVTHAAPTTTNNLIGCWPSPTTVARPYNGGYFYLRYYTDKVLTEADVAILYANRSTINWDFQTFVNYNKLTSLPKNWNSLQVNSRGNWVYDGSSNYTSYLDEYGRPQTVKGDNYDLILPFHFYPSKAFLRTIPLLPTSSSNNPHNYPASVKFLGSSNSTSKYHLLGEFSNKAIAITSDSSANYTYNSVVTNTSGNYIHGADFLYDLNHKYYINQLRMIVDQAPDSSGNSYGQYSIDRLAYSGSSFSGKKLENSYPNLYLNTAAHDISYGFTEDHTNIVYDLSHNKNQLPIIDMSGAGGIHIAPREISIQDGSLNTINIHKPIIKNTYSKPTYAENTYSSVAPAIDASFNTDFYSHFGARDASDHFNKRISQDGKTIVTLQNRGTQGYDLSNAEVVFSTDYGKNWKNILRDCSDSFLFTENDISYGLLFATGDVSGAIDIATSSNGQTMYVGRHRSIFSDANTLTYGELGYSPPQEISIPGVAATNTHTGNYHGGNVTNFRYFPQCFIGNNTGSSDITVSNLTGNEAAFNGTFKVSMSSGLSITNSGHRNLWGILGTDTWSGQYTVNGYTLQASNFNNNRPTVSYVGGSVTLHYLLLEFPAYVKFDTWYYWVDDRFRSGYFIGTDANGDNQLLGSWSDSWNNGQAIYDRSFNGANNTYVNKLYIMLDNQGISWGYLQPMWFTGTYQLPETRGAPIPTNGVPEIYSTNYGNSWKISPRKYHKGPTIISGDGSTILILQESKLNNTKHAYTAINHGNNSALVDTHWITTDYGSNWNTLNRSGYDISNNVIPPSYGSKTATFLKACMSYTGQYIYIYNVQCTTNNNYGELYYSHDYGNTWNKWTTVEAQNYVASGNTLAGSGQILCSGNGKYVFIAGQTTSSSRLSQAIYYRSTDYGVTFNKDITTFPWQEGSSGEDSTSRGPFISYEGDLIVISNTHYKYIDDSDATQSYSSTTDAGLKYSLDYGVNYNVLDLSGESLSNATTNFSNLPNKTNKNFSSLFSTKGDIFSNCPGPNDYSFLTSVMGGNTTDASFVFLQSIEFPKDKVSTTVEKEGPVITTYEEPIDTENDFGNITNTTTLTSGVSYYSSAISEDGQVLLTAGASDISNGSYYGAYNLTNAKFPPTENVNDSTNIIAKPIIDFDFRVASTSGITDSISGVAVTYNGTESSTVSGGYHKTGYDTTNYAETTTSTFSGLGPNFSVEFYFMHSNTSETNNTQGAFIMYDSNTPGDYLQIAQDGENRLRFVSYINGTTGARWHTFTNGANTKIHYTFVYDYTNQVARMYENGSYLDTYTTQYIATTHSAHLDDGNLKELSSSTVFNQFNFGGTVSGRMVAANYYYTRVYNKALTQPEIDYLYANRETVSASLASYWTVSPYNNLPQFKTANLSYSGNYALLVPYGLTQQHQQKLIYWSANGDFHRFDGNYLSNFDAENWKFGKLSGNGNFFVGFTHSSSTLSDASYNSATWWQDKVSNTMIIYKNLYTIPRGTVSDSDATTYGQGTTYDLNTAFSTDSGVTEYYITSVHVSETGQYVLFVGGSSDTTLTNRCAFSKDYGATFTNITSLFSFTDITKPLVYCHVSDNGRYLFISQYNSSEYCFSTNYGTSFTLHNTFPSSTKTYGVVSKDGQNALFVDTNKHVYVSVNGNFRQEVIPSLSGTNTNLSLNHNYWKYKTTLTNNLYYNPSMPNIKYLIGTLTTLTAVTHSSVRYTESYFSELDIKGSLTNLSGTAYTSSDYRVKENVRDLEDSDSIASLAPISYTQNNLHHKKSIGFLAHEFAESFPDLVDGTKDGPEMQSINYNGIIAVLIKEIQTLRSKINKLKSEI